MIYDFDLRAKWDTIFHDYDVVERINKYQDIVSMGLHVKFL